VVKRFLNIFTVFALSLPLALTWPSPLCSQGLDPLKPQEGLSGSLHIAPDESSAKFREIQAEDRVSVLRSQGEWYEIDLVTPKGVEFRGWVRGALAPERAQPRLPVETLQSEKIQPLQSEKYRWFWSGEAQETAKVSLFLGTENLKFSPKGAPTGSVKTISGYKFWGFSVGPAAQLSVLETEVWTKNLRWLLSGQYQYGFFQVAFGNSPALPADVQGASYRIHTHQFRVESKAELRLLQWQRGYFNLKLGAGYLSFDDSPDLRRTDQGNVVFTQFSIAGLLTPLEAEAQWAQNYRIGFSFSPIWLARATENPDASASDQLKASGLSWIGKAFFEYQLSDHLSLSAQGAYLSARAKHPGRSRRINADFDNVKIDVRSLQVLAGAQLHF
jgi:hypothetical protein